MKSIPILLKMQNILDKSTEHTINTFGILIHYMKKQYIITIHHGLPVDEIIINNEDKKYTFKLSNNEFIICAWNDLILIPYNIKCATLFVFKQFVQKQINFISSYQDDLNLDIKYIKNENFPLNMIPYNPENMYYKMSSTSIINESISGKPIYNNNKLVGLIAKVEGSYIYIIPTIYILKSIEKNDNTNIYIFDTLNINKIGFHKIINNMIYYRKFNTIIPLDSYLLLEGDIDKTVSITSRNITKTIIYTPFINHSINNKNTIDLIENNINITSSFIHLMKICYNDNIVIRKIFEYMNDKKRFEYIINNITYIINWVT